MGHKYMLAIYVPTMKYVYRMMMMMVSIQTLKKVCTVNILFSSVVLTVSGSNQQRLTQM